MRLPRELYWALLAAPLVVQPIANEDFFHDPPQQTALEIAGNYLPTLAILAALSLSARWVGPGLLTGALATTLASALVYPLHMALLHDPDTSLLVYLQRNVGFTCLLVVPALALERRRQLLMEQRQAALRAQIELLKARTQPHFLFNVLNTLTSLIRDDVDAAERTLYQLAELLRAATESTRQDTIPLARELEIIEAYLEIEHTRHGDRLRYEIQVEPELRELPIAPFLLHPLIENAVFHGVSTRKGGKIRISATRAEGLLTLRVEDDGPGISPRRGAGVSLDDLRKRLELLYGERGQLRTQRHEGGFVAELTVPA